MISECTTHQTSSGEDHIRFQSCQPRIETKACFFFLPQFHFSPWCLIWTVTKAVTVHDKAMLYLTSVLFYLYWPWTVARLFVFPCVLYLLRLLSSSSSPSHWRQMTLKAGVQSLCANLLQLGICPLLCPVLLLMSIKLSGPIQSFLTSSSDIVSWTWTSRCPMFNPVQLRQVEVVNGR